MIYRTVVGAVLAAILGASCAPSDETATADLHDARQDSVAAEHYTRFGRPPGFIRGTPDSVLVAPVVLRVAAYEALFPEPHLGAVDPPEGQPPADHRPWLRAEFLPDEGRYERYVPMDEELLQGLLATARFRGACGGARLPACPTTGITTYEFSALYRVSPGVLRVFLARGTGNYAEENMFRLEQRGETWMVADQALIMIT